MSNDIASDGLFGICSEHGSSIYLCHHLVRDDDGHAKLQEKQPKTNYFPQLFPTIRTEKQGKGHRGTPGVHKCGIQPLQTNGSRGGDKALGTFSPSVVGEALGG